MRTIDSTFKSEKNKSANQPVRLYKVFAYDGTNNLLFAEYDADVTYNSETYTKFPITFDKIAENNRGGIDQVSVTVANISRLIQAYLEQYDFRNKKVRIRTVWANQLADAEAYIDDIFYVDSYTADENNVTFVLTTRLDVLSVEIPLRKYTRNYCQWKYKGTECGAASAIATCGKTIQDCRERNNYQRFGGFPSTQPNKVVIG